MRGWAAALVTALSLLGLGGASASGTFTVFDAPLLVERERQATALLARGNAQAALAVTDALVARFPEIAEAHARRSAALAALGRDTEALNALDTAVELGFRRIAALAAEPAFSALRENERLVALARSAAALPPGESAFSPSAPSPIADGIAPVSEANTDWLHGIGMLRSTFIEPEARRTAPIAGEGLPIGVARLLTSWEAEGQAAGNLGDLYDNRDEGHSTLSPTALPGLARISYAPEAQAAGVHRGLADRFLFNRPTIGNSSTAITGTDLWRSQPRLALTTLGGPERLFRQYISNHLYAYPEHRDHDPGNGDLFPALVPFYLVSQGSSGTDQPLLKAMGAALAALKPEVKALLAERGLIAPVLQMLVRRGQPEAESDAGYLSGAAHRVAIEGSALALDRIVRMAHALDRDTVPPMVVLRIIEETRMRAGRDFFMPDGGEALMTTPTAIARIVRGTAHRRMMRVSAGATQDPNGRPLTFHWRVLRGAPERVQIRPHDARGDTVDLIVDWHDPYPVPGRPDLSSQRVDIGVFADNGATLSAPATISYLFPPDQRRDYDFEGRILSVDYAARDLAGRYVDPQLFPARDWRDDYVYDAWGRVAGWERRWPGGAAGFTHDGKLVTERDALGRPVAAEGVAYSYETGEGTRRRVLWEPNGVLYTYAYDGDQDRIGTRSRVPDWAQQ